MRVDNGILKVHYDGNNEYLNNHQMNAKFVSKSIKAIDTLYCEAFTEMNKIYNHNVKTEVYIEGGFNEGSIWWLCRIFGIEREQQNNLDSSDNRSLVSFAVDRIISIIKKFPVDDAEIIITETTNGYEVLVDNERVTIDELECALLTNEKIRNALSDLASPLNEDGIDSLTISDLISPENQIKITKSDKHNLIVSRKHKQIVDDGIIDGLYYAENLSYNPHSKWKLVSLLDPKVKINATIIDPVFLKTVANNQKFSKNDVLNVKGSWYKEKSRLTGKISSTYTIIEVRDHVRQEDKQLLL
jgi:hypothetical protein